MQKAVIFVNLSCARVYECLKKTKWSRLKIIPHPEIKPATMKIPIFKQKFPVGNEFRSRQALPDVEDEKCNAIECSKLCVSKVGKFSLT